MARFLSVSLYLLSCTLACITSARADMETELTSTPSSADVLFERELTALANNSADIFGVGIRDLTTGKDFLINADRSFSQAGLSKLYVLAALMRESSQGRISLEAKHTLSAHDKLPGGILNRLGNDSVTMSFRDYANLMVTIDDNSATQVILSKITKQAVNDTLRALGSEQIRFAGLVTNPQNPEDNLASPRALLDCLEALHKGHVLDSSHKEEFFSMLSSSRPGALRNGVPRHIRVASKSGSRGNLRSAAGIVFLTKHPYAIVIMSQPAPAGENAEGTTASNTASAISKLAYAHFSKLEAPELPVSEANAVTR
jgi:beta-lactamase class A